MKSNEKKYGAEYWEFYDCEQCGNGKLIPDDSRCFYTCECCGADAKWYSEYNELLYLENMSTELFDYDEDEEFDVD